MSVEAAFMSPPRTDVMRSSFQQNTPGSQSTPGPGQSTPRLGQSTPDGGFLFRSPPVQFTPCNLVSASPLRLSGFSSPPYTPPYSKRCDEMSFKKICRAACAGEVPSPGETTKRGRPRAHQIEELKKRGIGADSAIQCPHCSRVFPRDKSLQAHMRTHTGERPYVCDYPDCTKRFCQSGQLKTHQRLHSKEKPFKCSATGCHIRFTHANRRCADHPANNLCRDEDNMPVPLIDESYTSPAVQIWHEKYMAQRHEKRYTETRLNSRGALTQPKTKRSLNMDLENQFNFEAKRLKSTDSTDQDDLSDCGDVGANESFSDPQQIHYDTEGKNQSFDNDNIQSSDVEDLSSNNSVYGNIPLTPKGFHVSVIRRAPITNCFAPQLLDRYLSPMKEFENVEAMHSPTRPPRAERSCHSDHLVAMSPIKSPRKQAALALMELSNSFSL